MTTSLLAGPVKDRSVSPDKNILPYSSGTSVYEATDLVGKPFSIKGFRELSMITPAGLEADGVTAVQVQVSNAIDGDFGVPADFPEFIPVTAVIGFFQTGVVLAPWNYAKIVFVGATTIAHNVPYNLT